MVVRVTSGFLPRTEKKVWVSSGEEGENETEEEEAQEYNNNKYVPLS